MAITTYAELKTAIATWLHRSDLTTVIPDFVALAEADIRRDLRIRAMEATATGTLTSTTLSLPTGFIEARRVILGTTEQDYVTPQYWHPLADAVTNQYTVLGTNFVFQSASSTYQVDYYKSLTAFSADGDTNTLLTTFPGVYLYASLMEACGYTLDDPSQWVQRYQAEIAKVRSHEARAFGPLAVRVNTGNTP